MYEFLPAVIVEKVMPYAVFAAFLLYPLFYIVIFRESKKYISSFFESILGSLAVVGLSLVGCLAVGFIILAWRYAMTIFQ